MKKALSHHVQISLDTESLTLARQLAERRDTSVSGMLRDLMREEVERIDPQVRQQQEYVRQQQEQQWQVRRR
jgi:hypothetical protein